MEGRSRGMKNGRTKSRNEKWKDDKSIEIYSFYGIW